jgi:hypothetical protein
MLHRLLSLLALNLAVSSALYAAKPAPVITADDTTAPAVSLSSANPFSFSETFNEGDYSEVPCHLY